MKFNLLGPEFLLAALAFLIFTLDLLLPKQRKIWLAVVSIAGLLGILVFSVSYLWGVQDHLFDGLLRVDDYALFFKVLFIGFGVILVLMSIGFVKQYLSHPGEYYAIILISVLAMTLLAASGELLTAYIALELLSFCLYILAGYARYDPKSNEASVKYILLGAFSSALLLYGISLLYGVLGSTHFSEMSIALEGMEGVNGRFLIGMALLVAGFGFKLAVVPFHMWAPDVYEGAPLPITAYIAVGSKAAAIALVLRVFSEALWPVVGEWGIVLAVLAGITMVVGNLVALTQHSFKRMLAYSSIGQVGYMVMGVAALSPLAATGLILHVVGYAATNLIVFSVLIVFYNSTQRDQISDFAGFSERSPFLAGALTIALLSLAGLPFFAGFVTKFYLFLAVANGGYLWLSGLAIAASVVSLYYYLMVIKQMYIEPARESSLIQASPTMLGVIGALAIVVVLIGVYPAPLLGVIEAATATILP